MEDGTTAAPPGDGSDPLASPPTWQVGDWWRIEVTDRFTGEAREVVRVVAQVRGGTYLVGMPQDAWRDDILILHLPGFGEVDVATLGFDVHDERFQPLQFPLAEGATWATTHQTRDVTAEVVEVTGSTATVELVGDNDHVTLVYDGEMGVVRSFEAEGYLSYEVLEQGSNWTGTVRVPTGQDLIFLHGRIAGALGFDMNPHPPVEQVEVLQGYDRATLALILGDVAPAPAGAYLERATAPDGTTYQATKTPADPPLVVEIHGHEDPEGTWRFDHGAAGAGFVLAEGIAYGVMDVELG